MNKKGMGLALKTMMGIFLVMFVFFVFWSLVLNKSDNLAREVHFDAYTEVYDFYQSLLGSKDCFAGSLPSLSTFKTRTQSLISASRLDLFTGQNKDLFCAVNYGFVYNLQLKDTRREREWVVGINELPMEYYDRVLELPFFVSFFYSVEEINPGTARLKAYFSKEIDLYLLIKRHCSTGEEGAYTLDLSHEVFYSQGSIPEEERFCIDDACFHPAFSCDVESFTLPRGTSMVFLGHEDGLLKVIV